MTAPQGKIAAAILCGGRSRRFGSDKARASFGSTTVLAALIATLKNLNLPVALMSGDGQRYSDFDSCEIADPQSDLGPLGGIQAALQSFQPRDVLIISCDMPLIDGEILQRLLAAHDSAAAATGFVVQDRLLPFPAIYAGRLLDLLKSEQLPKGSGPSRLLQLAAPVRRLDGTLFLSRLINMNTPADHGNVLSQLSQPPVAMDNGKTITASQKQA